MFHLSIITVNLKIAKILIMQNVNFILFVIDKSQQINVEITLHLKHMFLDEIFIYFLFL